MDDIYPVLQQCGLFEQIPEAAYPSVLGGLRAGRRSFRKGDCIRCEGEKCRMAGLILAGEVEITFPDEAGSQINVDHRSAGDCFGIEAACAREESSPIRLTAVTDCRILFLDFSAVLNDQPPLFPYRDRLSVNLLQSFARQNLFLSRRLRILGQKRLRDKIKVYLRFQNVLPDGTIHIPFKRGELADYLYVDRSALSRELGRMCAEGLIACKGRMVRVLDPDFLSC